MADYTYEQVMQALRAADAAASSGDQAAAADAQRLAQIASQMSQSPAEVEQEGPTFKSVMGQINKEIAEGVGGLVDFINPFDPYTGSAVEGLKSTMRAGGIYVPEREAEGIVERAAAGIGQAASAVVPVAKGAQMLQKAGGLVGQVARQVAPSLMSTGGVAAELAAGAGSGAAQAEAERRGYGDVGQQVAGLLGGFGTGLAPMAARGVGKAASAAADVLPVKNIARGVAAQIAPFTNTGGNRLASQRFQELAGGKASAEALADRMGAESQIGLSPAQMTGEEAFMRAERKAMESDPALAARIELQRANSDAAAKAALGQDGDVRQTQRFLQERVASFENTLNDYVKAAQTTAERKAVSSNLDDASASKILGEELRRARDAARQTERGYWSKIPQDVLVDVPETSSVVLSQRKVLGEFLKGDIPEELGRFRKKYAKKDKPVKMKDLNSLYSKMRAIQRDAVSGSNPNRNKARLAGEVADAILSDLDSIQPLDDFGRAVFEARSFSKQFHDKFTRGTVGDLLQKKSTGDYKTPIELTLDKSIGRKGTLGEIAQRNIDQALSGTEGAANAKNATADYLRNKFNDQAFLNDKFTPARAQKFMRDSAAVLEKLPELRTEMMDAIAAQKKVISSEQRAAPLSKAVQQSTTARFAQASPEKAIDAVIQSSDPSKAMASLVQSAKKDQTGAALAGIKSALSQKIINNSLERLATPRIEGGPIKELRGTKLADVIDDDTLGALIPQVLSPSEVNRMKVISAELQKLDMARVRGSVAGGLDPFRPNSTLSILARVVGARVGARLGGGDMGSSLQSAQIFSSRFQRILERLTNDKAQQIMMKAIEDKELFRTLLLNPTEPKNMKRIERSLAPYLVGTAAAMEQEQ